MMVVSSPGSYISIPFLISDISRAIPCSPCSRGNKIVEGGFYRGMSQRVKHDFPYQNNVDSHQVFIEKHSSCV
jgi:hypothetical protein